ncbi:src kinase-associated phosphoprotein 2 [Xenentodon cancila]
MNTTLRKDSKKDCCFEISAPDKRLYQFCASSTKEAEEWVKKIDLILNSMTGSIPEEEEEQETYDDIGNVADQMDEIYEMLPEEEMPTPVKPPPKVDPSSKRAPPTTAVDKSTDYQNYYQGLWECSGSHPDELSFKRGDAIYILSKEYNNFGWWIGEKNGAIGIVPKDYLMEMYSL